MRQGRDGGLVAPSLDCDPSPRRIDEQSDESMQRTDLTANFERWKRRTQRAAAVDQRLPGECTRRPPMRLRRICGQRDAAALTPRGVTRSDLGLSRCETGEEVGGRATNESTPSVRLRVLSDECQRQHRWWRAANYLSVGQIYLMANPLLDRPLEPEDIKPRLLGHWGTTPGLNLIYAHLNRLIVEHDCNMIAVIGPGHGGPAAIASTWLDGSFSDIYADVPRDGTGMQRLFQRFSFPRGMPSHVAADVPGSINEGGELGYSLAHAFGAVFDNPDLIAACIVGDGEAETGALATSWNGPLFLDPVRDGAVLPVLHLNGYKIANPTVLGRRSDDEIRQLFAGHGWAVDIVDALDFVDRPELVHEPMAAAFDRAIDSIAEIQRAARAGTRTDFAERWPLIVLRSPKGWTGPKTVDGIPIEGTWRAHQVPLERVREDPDHLRQLEAWLQSYRPAELFDEHGKPRPEVVDWLPKGDRRLGANPHANGGRLRQNLTLPDVADFTVDGAQPGNEHSEPTRVLGSYLAAVFVLNSEQRNFRLFGPDETESNRLDAVYDVTGKAWQGPLLATDEHLDRHGRVMEVLSEHLCQGWLEGYLLTGRHGLFSCYEAFVHIVDSMVNQHAKWLKVTRELEWRAPISSLNYLLTSHVWRQDHNGFSHQDPGFVDHVVNKKAEIVRVYFPPDTNCLLHIADHCLQSRDLINVIISGKQPTPNWLDIDSARLHCERGLGIWPWASNDDGRPHVVIAAAGDVPTIEALAAVALLRDLLPELRVRFVNVVDLMRLQDERAHPHGLTDVEFDTIFTTDTPIIFAYHGYPWLIHRLTYRRHGHPNLHVRGYIEEGSTTTPFDMVVRNNLDRYHLVIDVVDRAHGLGSTAAALRQSMQDRLAQHLSHIVTHGEDPPEIRDWRWTPR